MKLVYPVPHSTLAEALGCKATLSTRVYASCEAEQLVGESLIDTAERLLIFEALRLRAGVQKDAAELLGISARAMNYKCRKYGFRPKDRP